MSPPSEHFIITFKNNAEVPFKLLSKADQKLQKGKFKYKHKYYEYIGSIPRTGWNLNNKIKSYQVNWRDKSLRVQQVMRVENIEFSLTLSRPTCRDTSMGRGAGGGGGGGGGVTSTTLYICHVRSQNMKIFHTIFKEVYLWPLEIWIQFVRNWMSKMFFQFSNKIWEKIKQIQN